MSTPRTDALWGRLMEACRLSGISPVTANTMFGALDEFRTLERENAELRAALEPFARLYRLNAPLNLDENMPLRSFAPGAWPTLADCKKADAALSPSAVGGGKS